MSKFEILIIKSTNCLSSKITHHSVNDLDICTCPRCSSTSSGLDESTASSHNSQDDSTLDLQAIESLESEFATVEDHRQSFFRQEDDVVELVILSDLETKSETSSEIVAQQPEYIENLIVISDENTENENELANTDEVVGMYIRSNTQQKRSVSAQLSQPRKTKRNKKRRKKNRTTNSV